MGIRGIAPEAADSQTEAEIFRRLQAEFVDQFRHVFADDSAPRTIVILPSLSLDREVLAKISGVIQY